MRETFVIKTPVFEGPLELLLSLIEKRKLHINDIALANVADEYMEHLQTLSEFPTHDVAQFVLVASTLVLIKSKSLLPEFALTSEEEENIEDLQNRLRLYRRAKELARLVGENFGHHIMFGREETSLPIAVVFAPHPSITVARIYEALSGVVDRLPKIEKLKETVVEKIMSLEDMMERLTGRIRTAISMRFSEFAKAHEDGASAPREVKVNTIVSFLAMLELVKQGMLAARQHATFSDIEMESSDVATPNYSA
jgi:segregation and condensation protein A